MDEYQPFPISNFRTGLDQAVEPWLLPRDAYQQILNGHLYRGVLEKVEGYLLFARMSYRNQMSLGTPDGVTETFVITLPSQPTTSNFYAYGTIVVGNSAEIFEYNSDASSTLINLTGNAGGTGTVNLITKVVTINFNTAPPMNTYSSILFEWDSASPGTNAIMGIKQYFAQDGSQRVMVFDQQRVGIINDNPGVLGSPPQANHSINEIPHDYYQSAVFTGDGSTTTFTSGSNATQLHGNFVPGTVRFYQFDSDGNPTPLFSPTMPFGNLINDNGEGALVGTNVVTASSFVNYVTGAYTITFGTAPATGNVFDSTVGVFGDLFTGGIQNFFTTINYENCAFFTNGVNPVFYYDGTVIHYLNTSLEPQLILSSAGVPTNLDLTTCLHVTVNRDRLLLLAPTSRADGDLFNFIYWSAVEDPFDFTEDNFRPAPTSQSIRAFGFINTDLIVRFASSERIFRYTSDAFMPFRWDSTNNIWDCDAPYSTISYDSWISTVGKPGIVGSDGVNIKRVDEIIPDFTDPTRLSQQFPVPYINQTSIEQCYGERFDDLKEGWLCFNSRPVGETQTTGSDNILAFNYIDSTYGIYAFPFSCLGTGLITTGLTWAEDMDEWQYADNTWNSYALQQNALIDLGGDQFDSVYELNAGTTLTIAGDATTTPFPVLFSAITKNLNPFIEEGQLARFGYVDIFVSAYSTTTLRVQFYVNDQLYVDVNGNPAGFYQENILTFTTTDAMSPTTQQTKVWKRVYVGAIGKEHTIRFYQNIEDFGVTDAQPVYIHAIVPYMKSAGRIFN